MDRGKAACSSSSSGQSSSMSQHVKREPRGPPSPTPSLATTVAHPRGGANRILSPITSSTEKCSISVRPLASLRDPDDKFSVVSNNDLSTPLDQDSVITVSQVTTNLQDDAASDWRAQAKSVRERLHYIMDHDNTYQDVIFEVHGKASTKRFPAHKLILRIASIGFDRLFKEADSAPNSSSRVDENRTVIQVKNIEPEIFQLLLKFIYTDEIDMTNLKSEEILQLLQAARMYEVSPLYFECVQMLKNEISDDVAIQLCEMGATYDDSLLLETALNHIASKAFDIFPSENFLHLSCESICRLIGRDDLRIDETSLFLQILHWAENKCMHRGIPITSVNLRQTLQDIIPKVRFTLMTSRDFSLQVVPTQILTSEELVQIFQYLSVDPSERDKLPAISFNTTPRRSKKSLAFEREDSLSDYHENSSTDNTPERVPRVTNPDCADITTTEPESETASIASTSSINRKRARKYERSLSSASSKSKRMKEEKSSTTTQLNDLFGEPDDHLTIISVENKTISLNAFISEFRRNESRGSIEVIQLKNVKVDDFKKLDGVKVRFPNLKEFVLNIHVDEPIHNRIAEIPVDKLLFFSTGKNKNWAFEDLWSMSIKITLIINGTIILKISPDSQHVTLNKFRDTPTVLRSLREHPLKSIVYSQTQVSEKKFPTTLRRLVLLGLTSSTGSDFFQHFKHLKDLTVVSAANKVSRVLEFKENFTSKDKLRKLGIGSFKLSLGSSVKFRSVEGLYLWKASWDSHFEEKFHQIFPNLKDILLIGPMKGSAKLLKNIMRIQSLSELHSWSFDWQLTNNSQESIEMKKIMASCGLSDEKHWVLTRNEAGRWEGKKLKFLGYQEQVYTKLNYDFIFENFSSFCR